MSKREEQLERKRQQLEEAKAKRDFHAYKVRCERWNIATLEKQIAQLEQKEIA